MAIEPSPRLLSALQSERLEDKDEAKTWRRVEEALETMQGPIAS